MSPSPWEPHGLDELAHLGIRLVAESGSIQQDRIAWSPCHRIIASEFAGENLFDRLTSGLAYNKLQAEVDALREIADLTNAHVQHEAGHFDLVRPQDRIYGHGSGLIMAAFAFPGRPSRFSDGAAGTYYAARDRETAIAETRFHDEQTLRGSGPCVLEKTVIQANVDGTLVDVRHGRPCPPGVYDPDNYSAGQAFGAIVRRLDGHGVAYDSVRTRSGECVGIFRPPALSAAVAVQTLEYAWDGARIAHVR